LIPPNPKLAFIENIKVGGPFLLAEAVAPDFRLLRVEQTRLTGYDFLSVLGDMWRPKTFTKNNPGSVTRSLHKCAVAWDYNQGEKNLVLVREPAAARMYWRTYLRILKPELQKPSDFVAMRTVNSENAGKRTEWLLDFTALALSHNFRRIGAQTNWQRFWQKREFWHYQHTFADKFGQDPYDALMKHLYG
jgi:hypothetical protein